MAIQTGEPSKKSAAATGESGKRPSTPPPTYSASVAGSNTTEETSRSGGGNSGYYISPAVSGPSYGPTPLAGTHGVPGGQRAIVLGSEVVPFYDPNSPHSIMTARSRARWRFFEAFIYAFIIWTAVGLFFGASAKLERDWKHRHPHGQS
ncbi:hypothetical protein FRC03_012762 [Tulasnella sp. 419]|nr:hypothetical protein FRC03_012762 [Tulasnella sp. 419]